MNKKAQLTKTQYEELVNRQKDLEEFEIPENSLEIERAKEFGDLSENAEYHSAKDKQSELINELNLVKQKINHSTIIKNKKSFDKIEIGHTVSVSFNNKEEFTFTLIGELGNGIDEVDAESKLGKNLLNKKVGDVISFESNDPTLGTLEYEILNIN